jgi:hypothetical protein
MECVGSDLGKVLRGLGDILSGAKESQPEENERRNRLNNNHGNRHKGNVRTESCSTKRLPPSSARGGSRHSQGASSSQSANGFERGDAEVVRRWCGGGAEVVRRGAVRVPLARAWITFREKVAGERERERESEWISSLVTLHSR